MSLCDTCRDPGMCCRNFSLWTNEVRDVAAVLRPLTHKEAEEALIREDLPFYMKSNPDDKISILGCNHLSDKGRCNIYEGRPNLCQVFKAGEDALCIETPDREAKQKELDDASR